MTFDAAFNSGVNLANPLAVRPILYIQDLANAIELILESDEKNEIFNLCSLNGNMKFYADSVSRKFKSNINHLQNSITYSFAMSNEKFCDRFGYQFEKNISVILDNIYAGYQS